MNGKESPKTPRIVGVRWKPEGDDGGSGIRRTGRPRGEREDRWPPSLTAIASVLLAGVFVLGVVNAFFVTPEGESMERPEDIFAEGTGTLSGKVIDRTTGRALGGVAVTLADTSHRATTNDDGWYFLEDVKDGEYSLVAKLKGYGELERRITFQSSYPHTEDMDLEEGGDPVKEDARSPLREAPERYHDIQRMIMGVLSIPAMIAAIFSHRRERFRIVLAGALLGTFSLGFGLGAVMSIAAMVLTLAAKESYDRPSESATEPDGSGRPGGPGRTDEAGRGPGGGTVAG